MADPKTQTTATLGVTIGLIPVAYYAFFTGDLQGYFILAATVVIIAMYGLLRYIQIEVIGG